MRSGPLRSHLVDAHDEDHAVGRRLLVGVAVPLSESDVEGSGGIGDRLDERARWGGNRRWFATRFGCGAVDHVPERGNTGGPRGTRTHNPRIKSPLLCQLS